MICKVPCSVESVTQEPISHELLPIGHELPTLVEQWWLPEQADAGSGQTFSEGEQGQEFNWDSDMVHRECHEMVDWLPICLIN